MGVKLGEPSCISVMLQKKALKTVTGQYKERTADEELHDLNCSPKMGGTCGT